MKPEAIPPIFRRSKSYAELTCSGQHNTSSEGFGEFERAALDQGLLAFDPKKLSCMMMGLKARFEFSDKDGELCNAFDSFAPPSTLGVR